MGRFWNWLTGKKTTIAGLALCTFAVIEVGTGGVSASYGVGLFIGGLGIAGFAEKANRHQAQILAALNDVARIGADLRSGNKQAAIAEIKSDVAKAAPQFVSGLSIGEPGDKA